MKYSYLVVFMILLSVSSVWGARKNRPIDQHGYLSVQGNCLKDKHGQAPDLKGISLSWSVWGGKKYYNRDVVNWLVKDFHISLLRVSMAVEPVGGYLTNKEEQTRLVREVTDCAIENGIYVLIDWHDHNAEKHTEQAKEFFDMMSRLYSGKPNVIYEIFNEPAKQEWAQVKAYALQLIPVIRQNDRNSIIVVGSPHWDQDVDIAALDPVKGYSNIVYSFHFYASDPNHQDRLRAKADKAMQAGIPLMVTEWGVGESNGNGIFDMDKTNKWMEWMATNQLSWAIWNLTDKKETTALLLPGASENGGWQTKMLTECGKFARKQLRNQK